MYLSQHWNLALTDVDEQFTRRRARKVAVTGGTGPRTGAGAGEQREFKVGESVFRIIKVKRKVEICVRHSPQLLLRGEHVVMVSREMQDTQDTHDSPTMNLLTFKAFTANLVIDAILAFEIGGLLS